MSINTGVALGKQRDLTKEENFPLVDFADITMSIARNNNISGQDKSAILKLATEIWNISIALSGKKFQDFLTDLRDFNVFLKTFLKLSNVSENTVSEILINALKTIISKYSIGGDSSYDSRNTHQQRVMKII